VFSLRPHQFYKILPAILVLGTSVGEEIHRADSEDNLRAGQRLRRQGRYVEAEAAYLAAVKHEEETGHSSRLAMALNNLAVLCSERQRYADAERYAIRALDVLGKSPHADDALLSRTLYNLGTIYHAQARYADAIPVFSRAVSIQEQLFGKSHSELALMLNNLAESHRCLAQYDRAEPLYRRALSIQEKEPDTTDLDKATTSNNL
jgi:tetratricopeptide (TPR) repeat protein